MKKIESYRKDNMTNLIYNRFKNCIILQYMDIKKLSETVKTFTTLRESNGTIYGAGLTMVDYGCFGCYFSTILEELKEVYQSDYNENIYLNKDGSLKYKNGECYAWTIYKHKIALTIEKMSKKGEI